MRSKKKSAKEKKLKKWAEDEEEVRIFLYFKYRCFDNEKKNLKCGWLLIWFQVQSL